MNFSSDAMADFEGLLEVNRKICKQQMAEKASPTLPTNCAVLPYILRRISCARFSNSSEEMRPVMQPTQAEKEALYMKSEERTIAIALKACVLLAK